MFPNYKMTLEYQNRIVPSKLDHPGAGQIETEPAVGGKIRKHKYEIRKTGSQGGQEILEERY